MVLQKIGGKSKKFSTEKQFSTEGVVEREILVENSPRGRNCLLFISRGGAQVKFLTKYIYKKEKKYKRKINKIIF